MEKLETLQARKIIRADTLKLLHLSAFDYACSVHPGSVSHEETEYKAKRRDLLCNMIDVAIDHRIKQGGYVKDIEELKSLKEMDKL